jgi:hypothetical protein
MEGLTDKQIRGIDLAVKALRKKYPFITGWGEYHWWEDYRVNLFIDMKIDPQLLAEYMKSEVSNYFPNNIYFLQDLLEWKTFDWDKVKELQENIEYDLQSAYEYLPDEYKVDYELMGTTYYKTLGRGKFSI